MAAGGFGYISHHGPCTLLTISDMALLQVKHHIIHASNPLTPCLLIKHDHSAIRAVTLHQVHFFLFNLIVSLLQLVMVGTLVFLLLIMLQAGRGRHGEGECTYSSPTSPTLVSPFKMFQDYSRDARCMTTMLFSSLQLCRL